MNFKALGRRVGLAAGAFALVFTILMVVSPTFRAIADTYTGNFLRDASGRIAVNCEAGCGAGTTYANANNGTNISSGTANTLVVQGSSNGQPLPVSGTFWQATQPVSGSVSLTGTLPAFGATPQFDLLGNAGGIMDAALNGTQPANALQAGCDYNSSLPTLTSGKMGAIQCDINGRLIMGTSAAVIGAVTQSAGPWTENQTQINGSAIATSASGVQKVGIVGNAGAIFDAAQNAAAPANELVMGGVFNTSLPSLTSGNAGQFQLDSSGRLIVDIGAGAGSCCPMAGNSDGQSGAASQAVALVGYNTSTWDRVLVENVGTNAAAATKGALVVQGSSNGQALPVSGSVSVSNFPASTQSAQGSSGNIVPTVGDTTVDINYNAITATTQIVAASASKLIYLNSVFLWSAGGNTVTLSYGTGTNCATGNHVIGGPFILTAQSGFSPSALNGTYIVPASQALCIQTSAAQQLSGWITYAQHS